MDRGNGNRPKKTKTISKSRKIDLICVQIFLRCCCCSRERNNKIVTLGPNKILRKSVIAGVCFSQTSVIFAGDLADVRNSVMSVIVRCPQGGS